MQCADEKKRYKYVNMSVGNGRGIKPSTIKRWWKGAIISLNNRERNSLADKIVTKYENKFCYFGSHQKWHDLPP